MMEGSLELEIRLQLWLLTHIWLSSFHFLPANDPPLSVAKQIFTAVSQLYIDRMSYLISIHSVAKLVEMI